MPVHLTRLTDPAQPAGTHRFVWLAEVDGTPVGSASLRLRADAADTRPGELELHVHPVERRRGTGGRLLDAAVDHAAEAGERALLVEVEAGSPGEAFLAARGFRPEVELVHTRLARESVDLPALAALEERHRAGPIRLVHWDGQVPDELAAAFATARSAMDDMPADGADLGSVDWDVARVHAVADAVAARGRLLHTVAALDSEQRVVGFTELVVAGDGAGDGHHYGTAVLPAHRGAGLARRLKAAAIGHALRTHPHLTGLRTDTTTANAAMRAVNDSLGYVPTHHSRLHRRALVS